MITAGEPEFVLDCSVTLNWCFEDENDPFAMAVLNRARNSCAVVPALWRVETANVILVAERRGRITRSDTMQILAFLSKLAIVVDEESIWRGLERVLALGRDYGLTAYDAVYLELAIRLGLPLATLDQPLIKAARAAGVELLKT